MTTFVLFEAMPVGPPRQVMSSTDPKFVAVAGWRRCRMKNWAAELTAGWAGVSALTASGQTVLLLEFRRVKDGVQVEATTSILPELEPARYFTLRPDGEHLMIDGPAT